MIERRDFHGAPVGAYVSEEGWLIIGDEAWTLEEWTRRPGHPILFTDAWHRQQRERKRLWRERRRLEAAS